ncbi:RNA polymerase sigma factor [Microbacterium sp. UFMG61]|uniref:RNA polymerase sigma factor n=1 Tax=Microbacterium sp. UFMG61 TaxID=2745935 RepID=UPI0018909E0F|nr:sigma-70 family RNA polymerase sigma factor [Microbacterium sp. UFMG61]
MNDTLPVGTTLCGDVDGPPDEQIVRAVRAGDTRDFALLWGRHADAARCAARSIAPAVDAEDLVSEAFATILRITRSGGGPSDAFRPYLVATVRNTALRWARGNEVIPIDGLSERDLSHGEVDPLERVSERSTVVSVLRTLSPRHRALLWYLNVEGMKPRELAPLMGMTPNAVSVLAFRARESFRRAWLDAHIDSAARDGCDDARL